MQVYVGRNRAKYDVSQASARWAIDRDRELDSFNIALVEAALGCCKQVATGTQRSSRETPCTCTGTHAVEDGATYEPLGLQAEDDGFNSFREASK